MKHIGYTNGKTWGSDFPSGPVKLFIPEPGMRENVSADHYEHIGWIIPDSDDRSNVWSGKGIYETHEHAGPDSRPAYVVREAAAAPPAPEQMDKVVAKITMGKEYGTIHNPLPPNDKHGIPTSELLSEALDFCAEELDPFEYPDYDSDAEMCCQRSNVYIRELIRRFPADPAPTAQPVTREEFEALVLRVDTIAHMLKPPAPTEPSMTFYDLDRAVNALHAAVSTRPNVTLPNSINVDNYFKFVGDVERAANTVRDEVEKLRRNNR